MVGNMIKYREGYEIDYIRLIELFTEAGRVDEMTEYKKLVDTVESSILVVTAWDYDYMVGFAHLTRDAAFNGDIKNLIVDNEYKNMGIEEEIINHIISYEL